MTHKHTHTGTKAGNYSSSRVFVPPRRAVPPALAVGGLFARNPYAATRNKWHGERRTDHVHPIPE